MNPYWVFSVLVAESVLTPAARSVGTVKYNSIIINLIKPTYVMLHDVALIDIYEKLSPHLNKRQKRLLVAIEADLLGDGGNCHPPPTRCISIYNKYRTTELNEVLIFSMDWVRYK